ncbi:hypothetical protein Pan216_32990 [Planctomycetes bacterium Pan216]|uniref:N-acetyltransferase domain-containing protein n=1 Tax=Kolteria novifilia TaxID=2527975 RepID=A0A518B675_9BACT|nr:hypothetical protein Pan216_32990 [Planctomycetes bacterium Pan216]
MVDVEFRWARATDGPAVLEVLTSAFHLLRESAKWQQARELVSRELFRFRLMIRDGRVIGSACVSRHGLRIGRSRIELAYLGQVSVLPEHQRQGLGSKLMIDLVDSLREEGYDLARLSGLVRFYRRFGWVPFPRRFVEFPLRHLQAGTVEMTLADVLQPNDPAFQRVRQYNPAADGEACKALMRSFNEGRTGSLAEWSQAPMSPFTPELGEPWPLVYEDDEAIRGYLASHMFGADINDFVASVNLQEVALDLETPEAVGTLFRYVLWHAHLRGARRVTARLPWDERLFRILADNGLLFEKVELFNAATGNMLHLFDPRRLLEKISAELADRWNASHGGQTSAFTLRIDGTNLGIELGETVRVTPDDVEGPTLSLGHQQFLTLVLGLAPAASVLTGLEIAPDLRRVMEVLFPVQPTATGTWG